MSVLQSFRSQYEDGGYKRQRPPLASLPERRHHPRDASSFSQGRASGDQQGDEARPEVFLKLLVLLVPREMQIEHKGGVKAKTDEQLETGIEAIQAMLAAAKVIDSVPGP